MKNISENVKENIDNIRSSSVIKYFIVFILLNSSISSLLFLLDRFPIKYPIIILYNLLSFFISLALLKFLFKIDLVKIVNSFSYAKDSFEIQTNNILNLLNSPILIVDINKLIISCNNAFCNFVEMDKSSLVGVNIDNFNDSICFLQNKNTSVSFEECLKQVMCELSLTTPNRNEKIFIAQINELQDNHSNVIAYIIVCTDTTNIRKEQENLHNQERLALIGQMGSGIIHESKNYLASIKGYCELLLLSIKEERQKSYVSKIQFIANDMNTLLNQYLSLSKPSELILDLVSVNELIESITYIIESPSFLLGSNLKIDLCEQDEEILADDSRIKHVIINMAKNAVEAMKEISEAYLTIQTVKKDNAMQIIISDNGVGIAPSDIQKLGTPFFSTKKTGTGLGLSNCYKIVQDCGGEINVSSKVGHGTTFTISLPVYKEELEFGQMQ